MKKHSHSVRNALLFLIIGFLLGVVFCMTKPWKQDSSDMLNTADTGDSKLNQDTIEDNADETITTENEEKTKKTEVSIEYIEQVVNQASELVSTTYHYKDADAEEDAKEFKNLKIPLTTSSVVFTYEGEIKLGIDLSKVQYSVDNDHEVITVDLPDPYIISNEIDDSSFTVVSEKESIFNPKDLSNYASMMQMLKDNKEKEVLNDKDLMNEVTSNTEGIIKGFLTEADETSEYKVVFS